MNLYSKKMKPRKKINFVRPDVQPLKVIRRPKSERELFRLLKMARKIVLIEDKKLLRELAKH